MRFSGRILKLLISSFKSASDKGELSSSQKQVVIKLIEKRDKDKRLGDQYPY